MGFMLIQLGKKKVCTSLGKILYSELTLGLASFEYAVAYAAVWHPIEIQALLKITRVWCTRIITARHTYNFVADSLFLKHLLMEFPSWCSRKESD